MKIHFITSTRIGDAVLSTGLLGRLVEHLPAARVTIARGPLAAPLFAAVPSLEKIIVLRKRPGGLHWLDLWCACMRVHWDLVVDLRRSAIGWLLRSRRRHSLPADSPPLHRVTLIGQTLSLDPPPARFAHLVRRLTGPNSPLAGARVAVACATAEAVEVRQVMEAVPEGRLVALVGEDPLTAFAVLRHAALFIGNDSGLMHMAAAAGVPTLGLFGPTDERLYGPWGPACAVVRDATEASMASLTVDAVEQAALDFWVGVDAPAVAVHRQAFTTPSKSPEQRPEGRSSPKDGEGRHTCHLSVKVGTRTGGPERAQVS